MSLQPGHATVKVPMTCGELVQGISGDGPFLVSCPIERYARVTATINETGPAIGPPERAKAIAAAERTLAHLGLPKLGVTLDVCADLPPGRGFGTSTADVVGAIVATARAVGHEPSTLEIARLAVSVEPSDSTMLPGLAVLDHRGGRHRELLGPAPPISVVVLDFGGTVDTVAYNEQLDLRVIGSQSHVHEQALALLRDGVKRQDPRTIGEAATLSALANQEILPKPALPTVLQLAKEVGAYGVCVAHSGTALGLLLPPDQPTAVRVAAEARRSLTGLVDVWATRLIDGGAR